MHLYHILSAATLATAASLSEALNDLNVWNELLHSERIKTLSNATLFIPTQEAAEQASTLMNLMNDKERAQVIANHAVPDEILLHPLDFEKEWKYWQHNTLDGKPFWIGRDKSGQVMINGQVKIIEEDILFDGGVAHIIDQVLVGMAAVPMSVEQHGMLSSAFATMRKGCASKFKAVKEAVVKVVQMPSAQVAMYGLLAAACCVLIIRRFAGKLNWRVKWNDETSDDEMEDSIEKTLYRFGLLTEHELRASQTYTAVSANDGVMEETA